MNGRPTQIELAGENALAITWSDGERREYTFRELRDRCPCATCREKHGPVAKPALLPVLSMAETKPLKIVNLSPVGNYAYSIEFSDGHDSGIYTLEYLRELGTVTGGS